MAIAIRPEFVDPPDTNELSRLVESIETLLADYLRRSILRRESDVPLSTVMRDLRALLDSKS
jgi:hypothetical protein